MPLTLNELYIRGAAKVPEAEGIIPSISTTLLDKRTIFREAEKEFVRLTRCLPKETTFNVVAENRTYPLSTNIPDYMEMRKEGIWHYRTVSNTSVWWPVDRTTMADMNRKFRTWRTQSSSNYIQNYWRDGDMLYFHYTPSTAVTDGFKAYYYATSSSMTSATDYPFTGSSTSRLETYHKCLVPYYEAKALEVVGYPDRGTNKLKEFYVLVNKAKMELNQEEDLGHVAALRPRMRMPRWGR